MKKIARVLAIFIVCCITITVPSAKSLKNTTLYGLDNTGIILKYNTESDFHTSIYPLYKNEDTIKMQNIIQRKDANGNWVKIIRNHFDITKTKRSYILNVSVANTADTRSSWFNLSRGTTIVADLYVNNGFDYDINIVPTFINVN